MKRTILKTRNAPFETLHCVLGGDLIDLMPWLFRLNALKAFVYPITRNG